jgi:hypothetical protein
MWSAVVSFFLGIVSLFLNRKPAAVTEAEQVGLNKATAEAFEEDNARVQAASTAASSIPSSGVRVANFESTDPNNRDNS